MLTVPVQSLSSQLFNLALLWLVRCVLSLQTQLYALTEHSTVLYAPTLVKTFIFSAGCVLTSSVIQPLLEYATNPRMWHIVKILKQNYSDTDQLQKKFRCLRVQLKCLFFVFLRIFFKRVLQEKFCSFRVELKTKKGRCKLTSWLTGRHTYTRAQWWNLQMIPAVAFWLEQQNLFCFLQNEDVNQMEKIVAIIRLSTCTGSRLCPWTLVCAKILTVERKI